MSDEQTEQDVIQENDEVSGNQDDSAGENEIDSFDEEGDEESDLNENAEVDNPKPEEPTYEQPYNDDFIQCNECVAFVTIGVKKPKKVTTQMLRKAAQAIGWLVYRGKDHETHIYCMDCRKPVDKQLKQEAAIAAKKKAAKKTTKKPKTKKRK